jgi:REP element-mobilizing transposase RayT
MEVYRIHEDVALYYLTFSVIEWLPVFVSEETCLIVTESLNFCHREKGLRINAFVIMPTHMHMIVFDAEFNHQRLHQTLVDMRKFTGRRLADHCEQKMPAAFGAVLQKTRRTDRKRQFWQPSRHPEAIWSLEFWRTKVDYLHDNPRRKGLVWDATHWRFSSAGFWLLDPPGESDVVLTAVEW